MKMPDDFDDRSSLAPTVIMSILAVTAFVAVILVMVLFMNHKPKNSTAANASGQTGSGQVVQEAAPPVLLYPETDELVSGSDLHPDDFDFWDMYPEKTQEPEPTKEPEETEALEEDPSTDGKHTLVQYADGKEEWVLISPYLPKHDYDFTKLVCQSDLMKYYDNGKQVSYAGVDISKFQDYVDFVKVKKAGIDFVMLRVGLAMDAFSVSLANGLNEPGMKGKRMCGIAGVFAFFQAVMPMVGWICVHTILQYFF